MAKNKSQKIQTAIFHKGRVYQLEITTETRTGTGCYIRGLSDEQSKPVLLTVLHALQDIGYNIPGEKILITIDAFDDKWNSNMLHLPIALGLMSLQNDIVLDTGSFFLSGRLSLNAELKELEGALKIADFARRLGRKIFLPKIQYLQNLSTYQEHVVPADNLKEIVNHLDIL